MSSQVTLGEEFHWTHVLPDRNTGILRTLSQALLLWGKAFSLADRTMWFSEVLRQTQTVPLDFFFDTTEDYTGYTIPNLTTIMIDHFWRCASLHIEGYRDHIEEIVNSRITTDEAPLLRWLLIHNISCSLPSAHDGEAEIPDTFLSVLALQLTSLHLEGCAFNWNIVFMRLAPHTPLLSSLCICNFHIQSATSIVQLLSVLELLPSLKDLRLQNSFFSSEMDWNARPHKVLLPQLTSLVFESPTVAGAMFLAALELPSLTKLEATVDVRLLSTDIHHFMEGVQLATCRMAHLPYLYIYYGHHLFIMHSNHYHCFPMLQVTFKNWALHDPAVPDTHFTNLIRGIANIAALWNMQDLKVSLPVSIEWHLAPDAWAYFLHHLKMISLISFGTHTLQITLPSIPKLKVLIDILAGARGQLRHAGRPIEVVHGMILDWVADPVVHSIPSDFVWSVDDESMDSDKADEIDELLDDIDTE
ncbi:hypothetical protein EDD17DRAFT_1504600 [Pisolithus thermaeus]|nr:hypothetical protein EDD17DRAFT_1504600 [Pisolithus thermaeus]